MLHLHAPSSNIIVNPFLLNLLAVTNIQYGWIITATNLMTTIQYPEIVKNETFPYAATCGLQVQYLEHPLV